MIIFFANIRFYFEIRILFGDFLVFRGKFQCFLVVNVEKIAFFSIFQC